MTAVFLLNRAPTRSLVGRTPYEAWYGVKLAVHFLRVFGCVAHVKVTKPNTGKLDDRSWKMVLIGYEEGSKAYRVLDPTANHVHITRDAVFEEGAVTPWCYSCLIALAFHIHEHHSSIHEHMSLERWET